MSDVSKVKTRSPREVNIYTSSQSMDTRKEQVSASMTVRVDWTDNDGKKYTYTETCDFQSVLKSLTEEELREIVEDVMVRRARDNALSVEKPTPIKEVKR